MVRSCSNFFLERQSDTAAVNIPRPAVTTQNDTNARCVLRAGIKAQPVEMQIVKSRARAHFLLVGSLGRNLLSALILWRKTARAHEVATWRDHFRPTSRL